MRYVSFLNTPTKEQERKHDENSKKQQSPREDAVIERK
tara:strand:+ start:389 stop:502 length:114 start_codon:yes stop_codon:yes gene_type:complete